MGMRRRCTFPSSCITYTPHAYRDMPACRKPLICTIGYCRVEHHAAAAWQQPPPIAEEEGEDAAMDDQCSVPQQSAQLDEHPEPWLGHPAAEADPLRGHGRYSRVHDLSRCVGVIARWQAEAAVRLCNKALPKIAAARNPRHSTIGALRIDPL